MDTQAQLGPKLSVSPDSWHYKLYQWWLQNGGGNKPGYLENLCHYMRVILIWVPLTWFFVIPIYRQMRPWMPVALAAILYFVATQSWFSAGYIAALSIICSNNQGFRPLWAPIGSAIFLKPLFLFVRPWMLVLAAWVGYSLYTGGIEGTIKWPVIILILSLSVIVFMTIVSLIIIVIKYVFKLGTRNVHTSFFTLMWQWALSQKRKVCPFIELPFSRSIHPN